MNPADDAFLPCACPHCGGALEFAAAAAGSRVPCPHCQLEFQLPTAFTASAPATPYPAGETADPLDATTLARAFDGPVPHRPTPLGYHAFVLAVGALLLLLPLGYFGLVGGLAFALVAFAVRWFGWVETFLGTDQFQALAAVLYVFGLFLGGLVLLFLLKPLLAPRRKREVGLVLDPVRQPLLFAFLHMIGDTVGAPHANQVHVDCRLNASASRRPSPTASGGTDLVLSLGLPLVACLTLRQLAGVVAHEFAHFNQRAGMRATHFIGAVIAWLERLAYGRDDWDVALETWTQGAPDWRTSVVAHTATAGVWLSRALIQALYFTGRAVSSALLRRMEQEADFIQTHVAGSAAFSSTYHLLHRLHATARIHYRELRQRWDTTRELPPNYPQSLAQTVARLTVEKGPGSGVPTSAAEPSLFATHPTARQRLQRAEDAAAPGVFHLDGPASALFRDFDALCECATEVHYAEVLRVPRPRVSATPA
ncbi:MAG: M48 family metallopeptidase [Verrucomicrobiales bacterium]|nr:M48 family metallopeptidase [Verrucomicrobiales bacterium]